MNGATAELCAKISSPPTIKSTMIIGVSYHHLFCQKNWSSSPAIANRLTRFWIRRMPVPRLPSSQGLLHDDIPEDGRRGTGMRLIQNLEIGRATSELQSRLHLVCRLLLEKKKICDIHE